MSCVNVWNHGFTLSSECCVVPAGSMARIYESSLTAGCNLQLSKLQRLLIATVSRLATWWPCLMTRRTPHLSGSTPMDELTAIAHEPRALDPEVLADVPPGALAQWQEIGAGLGHIGGMLAQVMGRAVLPRTIAVGEALNSLRNTHYKHHGDRLRFVAHAEALIGLKSRQAQKLEAFGKHRRLLQEYVEQHGLKPTSLLKPMSLLKPKLLLKPMMML